MKLISTPGERNGVPELLNDALNSQYDSVFLIGVKGGRIEVTHSGYQDIERKLGAIEMIKHDMISGSE